MPIIINKKMSQSSVLAVEGSFGLRRAFRRTSNTCRAVNSVCGGEGCEQCVGMSTMCGCEQCVGGGV